MSNSRAQNALVAPSKIIDLVDQALKARLLGSSTFYSGFESLDSVLNLQFRLHYHVIGSKKLAMPVCDVLWKDSQKLEKNLESYYTLSLEEKPSKRAQLTFVNETDRSAAYARLKFLLECAILESIDAYYSPEVWWYLSLIYEKYQDDEYKNSLLKCVKYQELNPVRSLRFCNY